MNKNSSLLLAILSFSLSSCFLVSSPRGLWFYTYSEGARDSKDSLLTPASFLLLRSDGSYTRDFGKFEYGSWTEKDHQLVLTDENRKMTVLPVLSLKGKEMQLDLGKGVHGDFESQSAPAGEAAESPFSRENNTWRIPATKKEDEQALRKRVLNHCRFWECYFNWALKNSIETIDVRSTPTAIKIYGNGFTLKPFEDLPAVWKSYFFDEEDCRKASEIIREIFQHRNIAWPHTDNKYKFFISGFQQMEEFLQ